MVEVHPTSRWHKVSPATGESGLTSFYSIGPGYTSVMRTIGVIATVLLMGLGIGIGILGVASIPDIKRYVKIREM